MITEGVWKAGNELWKALRLWRGNIGLFISYRTKMIYKSAFCQNMMQVG